MPDTIPDDLDAFFSAAAKDDPAALQRAAANVTTRPAAPAPLSSVAAAVADPSDADAPDDADFAAFLAVEDEESDAPFKVVPVGRAPAALPGWVWVSLAIFLFGVFLAIVLIPAAQVGQATASLESDDHVRAHTAMRRLVARGDDLAVDALYEMAASPDAGLGARFRAIDALSLIDRPAADRALLRLELASDTDDRVRQAAIAARRQRESSRSR